ncbi:MAG: glycosyl transferase [Phycisphaerales bacterium]|nr:glycosyl transferase [Phycisphaerales bacterium]
MDLSLHVALVPVGSHGDVHPLVGIGRGLLARGHAATVVTNAHFEPLARRNGLGFVATSTAADYHQIMADPDLWRGRRGFDAIARHVMALAEPTFDAIARLRAEHGDRLVVVGTSLAFGARVAQEAFGVPAATVHLSPAVFQSAHDMPKYAGLWVPPGAPTWAKRLLYKLINRVVDRALAGPVNAFRARHGLPPVRGIFERWWDSPDLVLATFPAWFAAPQPDWPPQARVVGFPLYDERDATPLPPELDAFLAAGPPPVAFTPGSAMAQGQAFFAASADACRRAGLRGVLLTRHRGQVPAALPPGVVHADYAPFSELLPRCAAVVHHGGIGTSAQALAAGCPQLVQPFAHDQPDNAARLARLGVARVVSPRRYTPARAARVLAELTTSTEVAERCREVAGWVRGTDAVGAACDAIEALGARHRARADERDHDRHPERGPATAPPRTSDDVSPSPAGIGRG